MNLNNNKLLLVYDKNNSYFKNIILVICNVKRVKPNQ